MTGCADAHLGLRTLALNSEVGSSPRTSAGESSTCPVSEPDDENDAEGESEDDAEGESDTDAEGESDTDAVLGRTCTDSSVPV